MRRTFWHTAPSEQDLCLQTPPWLYRTSHASLHALALHASCVNRPAPRAPGSFRAMLAFVYTTIFGFTESCGDFRFERGWDCGAQVRHVITPATEEEYDEALETSPEVREGGVLH